MATDKQTIVTTSIITIIGIVAIQKVYFLASRRAAQLAAEKIALTPAGININSTGGITATFNIQNKTALKIEIEGFKGNLIYNKINIGEVTAAQPVTLPPNGVNKAYFLITPTANLGQLIGQQINNFNAVQLLTGATLKGKLSFRLAGKILKLPINNALW